MIKNIMRVLSGFLILTMISILLTTLFNVGNDFGIFTEKLLIVIVLNILPLIAISFSCLCLERGDENPFLKFLNLYMTFAILVSIILVFVCLDNSGLASLYSNMLTSALGFTSTLKLSGFSQVIYEIYNFMSSTFLCVTLISILMVVQTNNTISSLIKKIAYGAIIINVAISLWITIKASMQETLPNVYDHEGYYSSTSTGFNFSSNEQTSEFAAKVYGISTIVESFAVVLLFISNYAFSTDAEIDATEVDYEVLKKEANKYSNQQINTLYKEPIQPKQYTTEAPKEIVKDASQTGIMNINNQLGSNSNVGQVKEAAKTTNVNVVDKSMDMVMPFSSGPVINESVAPKQEPPKEEAPVQQEQPVEHKDIQEVMKENQQQQQ